MNRYSLTPGQFQELRLSDLFNDPFIARAFRRGDDWEALPVPMPVRPIEPEMGELMLLEVDA